MNKNGKDNWKEFSSYIIKCMMKYNHGILTFENMLECDVTLLNNKLIIGESEIHTILFKAKLLN